MRWTHSCVSTHSFICHFHFRIVGSVHKPSMLSMFSHLHPRNLYLVVIRPHRDLLDELSAPSAYADAAVLSPTSALAAHAAHTAEALSALAASRAREEEEDAAEMMSRLPAPVSPPPTAAKTLVFVAENAASYLQGTTRCFLFYWRCRWFSFFVFNRLGADHETPGCCDAVFAQAEPGMFLICRADSRENSVSACAHFASACIFLYLHALRRSLYVSTRWAARPAAAFGTSSVDVVRRYAQ
jgi:hypothetical protein